MPWAPRRDRGCIAPRQERDAAYRAFRANDPASQEADRVRNGARWKRTRAWVLAREPLCRECAARGLTVEAADVDHIEPLRLRPDLAYSPENLQPLCRSHHNVKSRAGR